MPTPSNQTGEEIVDRMASAMSAISCGVASEGGECAPPTQRIVERVVLLVELDDSKRDSCVPFMQTLRQDTPHVRTTLERNDLNLSDQLTRACGRRRK